MIYSLILALISFNLAIWEMYRKARVNLVVRTEAAQLIEAQEHREGEGRKERNPWRRRLIQSLLRTAPQFTPVGERIDFWSSNQEIEKLLLYAGRPYGLTLEKFQGLKIELALIGIAIAIILFLLGFLIAPLLFLILPLGGYFGLILWLRRKAEARQREITLSLPDFLDTMSVTLKAGLPLDRALALVLSYLQGPLREELEYFMQRLAFGYPREQGWEELLARNRSAEFQLLIKALIQGHRLGIPVSDTFGYHAEQMRRIRREKAKEAAAKAGPKISFTTTLIIIPATMLLFGGLFLLNAATKFGDIFQPRF